MVATYTNRHKNPATRHWFYQEICQVLYAGKPAGSARKPLSLKPPAAMGKMCNKRMISTTPVLFFREDPSAHTQGASSFTNIYN